MRDGRGTHFDSELLDLFVESLDLVLAARQQLDETTAA
jgi:HD-GYP domain-containing protein (c-di-GMP phosphodiesterase class II)